MAPTLRLRPSAPEDLPFITALERRADHVDIIGQWSDAEHVHAIAHRDGREHWIVELGGAPAGYLIAFDGGAHYPGLYIKRILIADKGQGTGTRVVRAFLDHVFSRPGIEFAWLNVRNGNARAEHVYRKLGFERYDPAPEADRLARAGEIPAGGGFTMRIPRSRWVPRDPVLRPGPAPPAAR